MENDERNQRVQEALRYVADAISLTGKAVATGHSAEERSLFGRGESTPIVDAIVVCGMAAIEDLCQLEKNLKTYAAGKLAVEDVQ